MAKWNLDRLKPGIRTGFSDLAEVRVTLEDVRQLSHLAVWDSHANRPENPSTARAARYWSQADEDGILLEILARMGSDSDGVFLEYGVGDGSECNTLVLLSIGWRGGWMSGEHIVFEPRPGGRLMFNRAWITRDNVIALTNATLASEGAAVPIEDVDVVSLDLDGNDYHITKTLLAAGLRPRVWIAEYNPRFPAGSEWVMPYSDSHEWAGDDYYGASISSFSALFNKNGYFPVACSAQGSNVFFVRGEYSDLFADVPKDLRALYRPMIRMPRKWGHRISPRTLESLT